MWTQSDELNFYIVNDPSSTVRSSYLMLEFSNPNTLVTTELHSSPAVERPITLIPGEYILPELLLVNQGLLKHESSPSQG